jgi:hypothetical protein
MNQGRAAKPGVKISWIRLQGRTVLPSPVSPVFTLMPMCAVEGSPRLRPTAVPARLLRPTVTCGGGSVLARAFLLVSSMFGRLAVPASHLKVGLREQANEHLASAIRRSTSES